jgi:protein phosphatase
VVCQIDEGVLGGQVKCGKCSQVFTSVKEPAAATVSAASPTSSPATSTSPESAPDKTAAESAPAAGGRFRFNSLWSGVRNVVQKITPKKGAGKGDAENTEESTSTSSDADIGFDLDAPGADQLKQTEEDKTAAPVLGNDPPSLHGLFRLNIAGCTSVGRVRKRNEDSFLIQQFAWSSLDTRHDVALAVVADGMGGYDAGDRASKVTIHQIAGSLGPVMTNFLKMEPQSPRPNSFKAPLTVAVKAANSTVHQQSQTEAGCKGMGATAAVVLILDGKVDVAHVGDCRVYHFHQGTVTQLTRDQTLVERMIELGQLTRDEAETHSSRNEVTNAVGRHPDIEPAYYQCSLVPGDWLVVACDGLHTHVNRQALTEVMQAAPSSADLVAHHLVALADHLGGSDNCTVVAIRCF